MPEFLQENLDILQDLFRARNSIVYPGINSPAQARSQKELEAYGDECNGIAAEFRSLARDLREQDLDHG